MSKTAKMSEEVRRALLASGVDPEDEQEEPALEAPAPEPEAEVEPEPALEAVPTESLLSLARENAKLELQVEQLNAKLTGQASTEALACSALRVAVGRLSVAVGGGTVIGLDNASLDVLCGHFNQLNERFEKTFPNKAVARPVSETSAKQSGVDPEMARRINVVQQKRNK